MNHELNINELNEVAGGIIKINTGTGPFLPTTTGPTFPDPSVPPFGPYGPFGPCIPRPTFPH